MTDCKKVFIDTAPFIYYIEKNEDNPQYFEKVKHFFAECYDKNKDFNINIAKEAAGIRAEYKTFKSMDALQLAAAALMGCDLFLTNDKQLKQFAGIRCITVDKLE